jgi:hypothetical protein
MGARIAVLAAVAAIAACGRPEGRGGLTSEEERQLDNAAKMLDDNMIDTSPDSLTLNEADVLAEENLQPTD